MNKFANAIEKMLYYFEKIENLRNEENVGDFLPNIMVRLKYIVGNLTKSVTKDFSSTLRNYSISFEMVIGTYRL